MAISARYIPGDHFAECDRCGLSYRNSQLFTEYTGLRVCRKCYDKEPVYPTMPPDIISVSNPRPEQETTANDTTYNYTYIGENLFPDPWMALANDGLWFGGQGLTQEHVQYNDYSRKISTSVTFITVSGLTIGKQYRFMSGLWLENKEILVSIISPYSTLELDIFKRPKLQTWVTDTTTFIADNDYVQLWYFTLGTAYVDGVYIQEYISEDRSLTKAEILDNKKPQADFYEDNTVTPDPNVIEYYGENLFPDPTITTDPTGFTIFCDSGPIPTQSRSSSYSYDGDYSLKLLYPGAGFSIDSGAYRNITGLKENTQYRFLFYVYSGVHDLSAGFGSGGETLPLYIGSQTPGQWEQTEPVEFTTGAGETSGNIYFGFKYIYSGGPLDRYYDFFQINEYANLTTPF